MWPSREEVQKDLTVIPANAAGAQKVERLTSVVFTKVMLESIEEAGVKKNKKSMSKIISSCSASHKDTWRARAKQDSANLLAWRGMEEVGPPLAAEWKRKSKQHLLAPACGGSISRKPGEPRDYPEGSLPPAQLRLAEAQESMLPFWNWFSKKGLEVLEALAVM